MIRKVSTPIGNIPNDKPLTPSDPTKPDDIIIFDGNFTDGTGDNSGSKNTTTMDLTNKSQDIKEILNDYTKANGGDYKKTYNELVRQLKENSSNEEFVTTTINRLMNCFDQQYDKNDNPSYGNFKSIAATNEEIFKTFLTSPDSEGIKHAMCGSIHQFGMNLLNDAGYNAGVISGDYLESNDNKGYHYALMYKLNDKKYVFNNYGYNAIVQADNIVDATKKIMSDYKNILTTFGNISIQGSGNKETYLEYFPKDEALFGEKIDKNTNLNILKDGKDVKNYVDFKAEQQKSLFNTKNLTFNAQKTANSQLTSVDIEKNNVYKNRQQNFDLTFGTKNTTSRYYDNAKDKAIDAKYQLQNKKLQFSTEVIGSNLTLEKNTRTEVQTIDRFKNTFDIVFNNKHLPSKNQTESPKVYQNNILQTNIKTLSIHSDLKKFYDVQTNNDNLKITPWVGASLNAYGTSTTSSITQGDVKTIEDNILSGDCRLKIGTGAYAQYKKQDLTLNANASIQKTGDIVLNNPSKQLFTIKGGNTEEVSFGANYKTGKSNLYGNVDFAAVNVPHLYNKTLLNTQIGINTQNTNKTLNTDFYAGMTQNSANLNMTSIKENIEKEQKYYIGARLEKKTKFGSIGAGVEYDKYTQGFKPGKNQGLNANASLVYKF